MDDSSGASDYFGEYSLSSDAAEAPACIPDYALLQQSVSEATPGNGSLSAAAWSHNLADSLDAFAGTAVENNSDEIDDTSVLGFVTLSNNDTLS